MFRKNKLPELLAPAGDMSCLYAAVAAGADAIYLGGKRFGARAFAKNFDMDELRLAVGYCHLHGVKLYVTLNTLVEDREMAEAVEYAAELYKMGVDALIVCDVGVMSQICRYVPDLELHASTQMSVHNTLGVREAGYLGATRVVLARELSLADIKSAVDNSDCEIEVFLHGALCVCYSGQCLFSSMVGGRSGNRGECAQPCRLPYNNGKYPLSLKDLSLADHIPELISSGVASLKIEGRMKSPDYVYTVVSIYRRLLDEGRAATKAEKDQLRRAFSRGGFTDGYFTGKIAGGMTGIRSDADKQDSKAMATGGFEPKRVSVRASVSLRLGEPARMTLTDGKRSVTAIGISPTVAENSPLTPDGVRSRLCKMGNTYLSLAPDDIELTLDDNINLPPSALNALRREAAELMQFPTRPLDMEEYTAERGRIADVQLLSASFTSEEGFLSARERAAELISDFDVIFLPHTASVESLRLAGGVCVPPVIFDSQIEGLLDELKNIRKEGVMYALVGNIGQISIVRSLGFRVIGDFRLNVTNRESKAVYHQMGVEHLILSPELTLPKARDIGGGIITYGRIPLMITERCFISENFGCGSCGRSALTDRKGERFPMIREWEHRNIILNSLPTYMGDRPDELLAHRLRSYHLIFTTESEEEAAFVLRSHKEHSPLPRRVRRVGRR